MAKNGYIGKIGNTGVQNIKAPIQQPTDKKGTVKTGSDLRKKGGK